LSTSLTNKPQEGEAGAQRAVGGAATPGSAAGAADTASASGWPWWASAAALLGLAAAAVLVWIVAMNAGAERFGTVPRRTLNGASFQLTHGTGHASGTSFVLESAQDGLVSLSLEVPPLAAEKYPRIEWDLRSADPPAELAFAWRTRENPRRTYSKAVYWLGGRVVPLKLDANDGWRGTIIGIALVARGAMPAPLEVRSVTLPSTTAGATLAETFAQWGERFPLKGYAITFPFDAERAHFMPITMAMAIACGIALAAYLGIAYLRARGIDWRVPWAVFAAAWILLDLRWQFDLGREVAASVAQFGGKTGDAKALAADDAQLVALALDLKRALPPPPARVIVLSDSGVMALRVAHFLLPLNVSRHALARSQERELGKSAAPPPSTLHSGDHVVLLFYSKLRYDPQRHALVWPDGSTLPAEIVVAKPEALLVRIS
jgi:hypothetical protein